MKQPVLLLFYHYTSSMPPLFGLQLKLLGVWQSLLLQPASFWTKRTLSAAPRLVLIAGSEPNVHTAVGQIPRLRRFARADRSFWFGGLVRCSFFLGCFSTDPAVNMAQNQRSKTTLVNSKKICLNHQKFAQLTKTNFRQ